MARPLRWPSILLDNANYFPVATPDAHSDAESVDLLMAEYPAWLGLARQAGLLH